MPIDIYNDTDIRFFPGQVKVHTICHGCQNSKGKSISHGAMDLVVEDLHINSENYCRWTEVSGRLVNEGGKLVRYPESRQDRVGYLGQCSKALVYVNGECINLLTQL